MKMFTSLHGANSHMNRIEALTSNNPMACSRYTRINLEQKKKIFFSIFRKKNFDDCRSYHTRSKPVRKGLLECGGCVCDTHAE